MLILVLVASDSLVLCWLIYWCGSKDPDLTNERRRLICAGRLFRTDSTFERKGMYELFVLLFDNYRMSSSLSLVNRLSD